jgi:hypothetical protein
MHHAYLYGGSLAILSELVTDARMRFQFEGEHNPDVQVLEVERFGIDEARQLRETAALRSISGHALYIVGVSTITTEAQQALLKLFEEPQAGVVFVLLAPHGSIIATLRSRMLPYPTTQQQNAGQNGLAERSEENRGPFGKRFAVEFLRSNQKDRSAFIAKLLKDDEGVRERARDFLQALESELYKTMTKPKPSKEYIDGLSDIAKVRSYANDRSPSFKMLLEHLAVSLPTL